MSDGPNHKRRRDLAAAIERAKPRDRLRLEDVALIWGVTKQRFVTVRNAMPTFPDPIETISNVHYYPAKKALKAMLAHELRHDRVTASRAARASAILGKSHADMDAGAAAFAPSQLAVLSRMAAETEEREREQGKYAPLAEVAAIAGDVFSEMSDFASRLSNEVDPHGLLAPEVRAKIDRGAHEALLRLHGRMKDILTPDAKPASPRGTPARARKARVRR